MRNIVFLLSFLFSAQGFSKGLEFKWNENSLVNLSEKQIHSGTIKNSGKSTKSVHKKIFNAWRQYHKTYTGYPLFDLLDVIYGVKWRQARLIIFVALDGYIQKVAVKDMLQAATGKTGYLSYKEFGKDGFTTFKRGKKTIDPGPLYMVWSHFSESDKAEHKDTLKWPYQLRLIKIISN